MRERLDHLMLTYTHSQTNIHTLTNKQSYIHTQVLSGEGADEVYGGYLYFHKAPNREEFQKETVRKLQSLHSYDCNRANKATSAWGLEARVPFLDRDFLDFSMKLDPSMKMITGEADKDGCKKFEKYLIRKVYIYIYVCVCVYLCIYYNVYIIMLHTLQLYIYYYYHNS